MLFALVIGGALYLLLSRTRYGTALRAIAVNPDAARLSGIDIRSASALAFAAGGAIVGAGGVLISMFLTFSAAMGVVFTMKALIVVIMGGVGNLLGALIAGLLLGISETAVARLVDPGLTIAVTYALFLERAVVAADRPVRETCALNLRRIAYAAAAGVVIAALAAFPLVASGYHLALGISLFTSRCWQLPGRCSPVRRTTSRWQPPLSSASAPTRLLSLPNCCHGRWCLVAAAAVGVIVALVVGLSTLRLSGIYFVIFSFGLAELIRQLVTWYEVNIHGSVGRYIFADTTSEGIYWRLLALAVMVLCAGWLIRHSRLGLAVRVIGQDETVARHCGIDTTRAKLALFAVSAAFMTVTGAVMAPRWTYIDPAIAFNPMLSFEVVIMALFGGAGTLFGPLLGAVPLVLLFEVLIATFPNYFSVVLGAVFIVIIYALPNGVIGLLRTKLPPLRRAALQIGMSSLAENATRVVWPRAVERAAAIDGPVLQFAKCARHSAACSRSTTSASSCAAAKSSG